MYAVIKMSSDGGINVLRTCHSKESVIIACQLEKEIVPYSERKNITAVIMDDGGYLEIAV